jgi:hypothetical protein
MRSIPSSKTKLPPPYASAKSTAGDWEVEEEVTRTRTSEENLAHQPYLTMQYLAHPHVHSALLGFAETWQVDEALAALQDPLPVDWNTEAWMQWEE